MNLAIFGATGQVGQVMAQILIERDYPVDSIRFFASSRSKGKLLDFKGQIIEVEDADEGNFNGIDIALFSCGAAASKIYAPKVAEKGGIVIDNSSCFRQDPNVPLVVPEVNSHTLNDIPLNIVANPNCTTMVAMPPLKILHDLWGLKKMVATTFQAVSGSGKAGVDELSNQLTGYTGNLSDLAFDGAAVDFGTPNKFPKIAALNVIPMAGSFLDDGSNVTSEELKLVNESRKILDIPNLIVSATCTRVSVMTGHSLSLTLTFEDQTDIEQATKALSNKDYIVLDNVPTPHTAAGKDPSYVGRIRHATNDLHELSLFVVGDNLRKGAALNAVQIAEVLAKR